MKITFIRIISLILLIYTFITIFSFSSQEGTKSSSLSKKVARKCIDIFPYTKNASEEKKTEMVESCQIFIRKLAHFSIYTCVGIFIMIFVSTYNMKLKTQILICVIVGFIYAISDEIHQNFIPERTMSAIDVIIDTIGTINGTIIVLIIKKMYEKVKG